MGRNHGIIDDNRNVNSSFRSVLAAAFITYLKENINNKSCNFFFSGEELKLSNQTKVVFETNQINDVSPGFISKCGLVITEKNELNWTVFLEDWNRKTLEDQTVMKWRRGQDELITGLFNWLVPPLISLVRFKCNSVIHPMPNALARYMLEFFTSTLSEAISNLKGNK